MINIVCSGYMAPEYAFNGVFWTKYDVFSFGIVLLEIISGKKSTGFHPQKDGLALSGFVSFKTSYFLLDIYV